MYHRGIMEGKRYKMFSFCKKDIPVLSHSKSSYFRNYRSILAIVFLLALSACGGGSGTGAVAVTACLNSSDTGPATTITNQSDSRISIINDETELDALITCKDDSISIVSSKASKPIQTDGSALNKPKVFSLTLVAEASPPKIVGKAAGVPWGVTNDMTSGGTYTGTQQSPPYVLYRVQIDTAGTPDTYTWSDDDGTSWQAAGEAITGAAQTLSNGVTVTFAATTGHTVGDYWNIAAGILQATSVSMKGTKAVVSFSMVGAPFLGAIQVYDLAGSTARLKSQALFNDTDINAVSVSGSKVFAVGAHEPAVFASILDELTITGSNLELPTSPPVTLPVELYSFAGTSVIHDSTNGKVYATDGNTGGLTVIDETTYNEDSHTALADARWVDLEATTMVVAQGGNADGVNGQITVYDATGGVPTLQNTFPFTGADIAQSKTTVEVVGGKAFIGAGNGGAQILSTSTGNVLATVSNPTDTGLASNLVVANAVSVDDDLMFISNGEAGVYVAQESNGNEFEDLDSTSTVSLTELGKLQFDSLQSVNHVAYKSKKLFIASGLGGLKIVTIVVP